VNIYNPASLKKRALRLRLELGMDPATEGGNEENEGESSMQ